jgi:predicted kinase
MAENTNTNTGNNLPLDKGVDISPIEYSSKDHNDIVDSLREATVSYNPDSKLNMDTIKFMDNQAASINKTSPLYPTRFSSPYPGNVSNNRNPFADQTGQFDLTTKQGRRDFLGRSGQQIANIGNDTPHSGAWKNPIIFGKKQMNADRYLNHSSFNDLGFHPFVDNETYYNQNSTAWDDLSRTSSAFVSMFKPAFTSGWRTLRNTLHGDPFKMDYEGGEAMRDAMRIASSTRGGVTGFMNDLYLNSAYTFGIVGSMFVEEAALAFMGGYALPAMAATRNAGRFKHFFDGVDMIRGAGQTVGNYSMDLMRHVGAVDKAKDFYTYAKGTQPGKAADWMVRQLAPETTRAIQTVNSTKNTAKNLTNLAKVNQTFGGFYRDLRMFNVAWAESRLEGALRELETNEHNYMKIVRDNGGKSPTDEQWAILQNASKSAGMKTALANFPIIFLSNKFVLDTALRGFKPLGRLLQEGQAGLGRRIMRTGKAGVAKAGEKAFVDAGTSLKRIYKEGLKGGLTGLGVAAVAYSKANIAEGFQELAQEAVSAGVGDYYDNLLDDVLSDSMNMNSAELEDRVKNADASWMESLRAGMQSEAVSFETFMSGFLMGGLVQPFQTMMFEHMPNLYRYTTDRKSYDEYAQRKKDYVKNVIEMYDEMWNNPIDMLDINKLDALNQRQYNQLALLASYNNDVMSFKDYKDQAIFSHIYTMLRHNKAGDFKAHLQAFVNMNDVDLANAFENSDSKPAEIRKRFEKMIKKIDQVQENYIKFNDKYVNPFDYEQYEEGTNLHAQEQIRWMAFEHAKMMFLFTKDTYERGVERMESILDKISANPAVTTMAANDIAALVGMSTEEGFKSAKGLQKEIDILTDEVAVAPVKTASKELKEQHKNKKEKLKILKEYRDTFLENKNYEKSGTKKQKVKKEDGSIVEEDVVEYSRRLTKAGKERIKKVFIKYLNHIAKTTGGQIADNDSINEAFEMIMDHTALKGRTADYYQASRILDNPTILNDIADRSAVAINKIWKHHKKKNVQRQKLTKFMDQQERGKIISELARKGIYTDVDDAQLFIKTGALPANWFSDENKINEITALDNPETYKTVQTVLRNYAKQKQAEEKVKEEESKDSEVVAEDVDLGDLDAADAIKEEEQYNAIDTEEDSNQTVAKDVNPLTVTSSKLIEFSNSDTSTNRILKKLYNNYTYAVNELGKTDLLDENNKPLDYSSWVIAAKGGAQILKARYHLHARYTFENLTKKRKKSFDEWLTANQAEQFFTNELNKRGLVAEEILVENVLDEIPEVEQVKKGLKSDEKLVETGDQYYNTGIKIIEKTTYNEENNQSRVHYIIRTIPDNKNAFFVYGGLKGAVDNLSEIYTDADPKVAKDKAFNAANWIKNNKPLQNEFFYNVKEGKEGKEKFITGEIVEDNKGNRYTVESKSRTVDSSGRLHVKSIDTGKSQVIDSGQFENEGWKRATDQEVEVKSSQVTKLQIIEPLKLYPYDYKSRPGETDSRDSITKENEQATLRNNINKKLQLLSPDQKDELVITIQKGDEFDDIMAVEPKDRAKLPGINKYPINPQLRKGASKYFVTIGTKDGTQLLVLASPQDVTLVDKKGNKIDPLTITYEQAQQLFRKGDIAHNKNINKQIQRNYAMAFAMEEVFGKLLEQSNTGSAVISLKKLRNEHKIVFDVTSDSPAFREVQREVDASTGKVKTTSVPGQSKIKELADNKFTLGEGTRTIDTSGKNREEEPYYIIWDQQIIIDKGGDPIESNKITNLPVTSKQDRRNFADINAKIADSMTRQGYDTTKSGRYVYFVYSPGLGDNGEYTAIQLKPAQKTFEQITALIHKLRDRMKITEDENVEVVNGERKVKDYSYTSLENDKLRHDLFISGKPGQHINFSINAYGDLEVAYINSKYLAKGQTKPWVVQKNYKYNYVNTILQNETGVQDLIRIINKDINKEVSDKQPHVADNTHAKISIQISGDNISFRESLPTNISAANNSFDFINKKTEAVITTQVRNNVQATLQSTDVAKVNIILNSTQEVERNKTEEESNKPINKGTDTSINSLDNDDYWNKIFNDGYETVDDDILEDIAKELAKNGEIQGDDKVADRKRYILEHPVVANKVEKLIKQVGDNIKDNESSNTSDASTDQTTLDEIDNLKEQSEKIYEEKYNEFLDLYGKEQLENGDNNPDYIADEGLREEQAMEAAENDPQVKALEKRIQDLDAQFKITEEFDGRDIEDINTFRKWLKDNLPSWITMADIDTLADRLQNQGITHGAFLMNLKTIGSRLQFAGQIYTSPETSFRYHEAFHAVFRLLLTNAEIKKYTKLGKEGLLKDLKSENKSIDEAIEDFRKLSPTYLKMSRKEAIDRMSEEWLADKFEEFKTKPKETKVEPEIKSLFQKIIDWIVSIFSQTSVADAEIEMSQLDTELHRLFKDIDSGRFKDVTTPEIGFNKFTKAVAESSGGISTPVYSIIKQDIITREYQVESVTRPGEFITRKRRILIPFTHHETDQLIKMTTALYYDLDKDFKPTKEQPSKDRNALIEKAVDMVIEMRRVSNPYYKQFSLSEKKIIKKKHKALLKDKTAIINGVKDYVAIGSRVENFLNTDDYLVENEDSESSYDANEKRNQQGQFKNVNELLRSMILTSSVEPREGDTFKNRVINPKDDGKKYKVKYSPDYIKVFNGLLKGLSGQKDSFKALKKMWMFAEYNEQTKAAVDVFIQHFFGPDGLKQMDKWVNGQGSVPTFKKADNARLFNLVMKAFYQFRVEYIQALRDVKSGNVSLISANKQTDEEWQLQIWSKEFDALLDEIRRDTFTGSGNNIAVKTNSKIIKKLQEFQNILNSNAPVDKATLQELGLEFSNFFRIRLGINLAPQYIEYSIAIARALDNQYAKDLVELNEGVPPINASVSADQKFSDIDSLIRSLSKGENLYNEADNENSQNTDPDQKKVTNAAQQDEGQAEGVYYRLQKWAIGNAAFDETVGSTVLYDSEGNYIYAHQVPSYHLEIAEEMNSEEGLRRLANRKGFESLKNNNLFNDERFKQLSLQGKLRIIRQLGLKDTSMKIKDGKLVEDKTLDVNTLPGRSFGNLTFNEFTASLFNMYGLHFNELTGKVKTLRYYDPATDTSNNEMAYNPLLIRVLSESNISDFQNVPMIEAIKKTLGPEGQTQFTDEYIDKWLKRIERKYNEIQYNYNRLANGERNEDDLEEGYNVIRDKKGFDITSIETVEETMSDVTTGRAYKFNYEVDGLLSIQKIIERQVSVDPEQVISIIGKDDIKFLTEGINNKKQKIFLKDKSIKGLDARNNATIIEIDGIEYYVRYEGNIQAQNSDLSEVLDGLGEGVQYSNQYDEDSGFVHKFDYNGAKYARRKTIANWFNTKDKTKKRYRIIPLEELKAEEDRQKRERDEDPLFDNQLKKHLEKNARNTKSPKTFSEAMDSYTDSKGRSGRDFIMEALMSQFNRFEDLMIHTNAIKGFDEKLLQGKLAYGTDKGVAAQALSSFGKMKLKTDDQSHNMKQIFFSNWLNTADLNEFYLGNQSMSLKDAVDAGKRAKMQNAGGASAASLVGAKEYGIEKVQKFGYITFKDPITKQTHNLEGGVSNGDRTDGQVYYTVNAFKHFWFGLGQLTRSQYELIRKIQNNEPVTAEEFFGQVGKNTLGYKQNKEYINAKKFVYGDGTVYLKMSMTILSPELDTWQDGPRKGQPKMNKMALYNMRMMAEEQERKTGKPMILVPETASKMTKRNVLNPEQASRMFNGTLDSETIDNAYDELDANFLRLQQVTPSNKDIIIEPIQIKNIITSEQSDATEVIFMGQTMTVGDIRGLYEYSIANRLKLNYIDRSNLIFDLPHAMSALQKSIEEGKATPDLQSFLDYALASLEASQTSGQLVEFFRKRKNGQNKYELNNPLSIQKYTELLLSFFQKGVIGQKQPGKSVVLMSDFGIKIYKKVEAIDENGTPIAWTVLREKQIEQKSQSELDKMNILEPEDNEQGIITGLKVGEYYIDRLRHDVTDWKRDEKGELIFDRKGNPISEGTVHTEFVLPPHTAEEMNLNPNEPIPDVIARQFGVRIPSQDKHSAVNLKLVDHLPVFMGSTGAFAYELLELSGADFDIDKLFIHNKAFYKKETEVQTKDISEAQGLLLPIGISGSGKSTYIDQLAADNSNVVVVSPDAIRRELTGDVSDQTRNKEVFKIAHERAAAAIRDNKLVVFDATNTQQYGAFGRLSLIQSIEKLADKSFRTYYKTFEVDPNTAMQRVQSAINNGVDRAKTPGFVIQRQFDQFEKDKNNLEGLVSIDEGIFYKTKTELKEYGKAEKLEDQFDEYMNYSEKEMMNTGSNLYYARIKFLSRDRDRQRRDGKDILISAEDVNKEFNSYLLDSGNIIPGENPKELKQKWAEEKSKQTGLRYEYEFESDEFEPIYKERLTKREQLIGALNMLSLPTNKDDYKKFREENKRTIKLNNGQEFTLYKEPYSAAYSNNILDFKYLLLGNDSMSKPKGGRRQGIKNEPAVDTIFSDIWDSWENKLPKVYQRNRVDGYDPNNMLGQHKIYRDSKEGARNIGAVVPLNTIISWLKKNKVVLRNSNSSGESILLPRLNGHTYNKYGINYFIDPITGEEIKGKNATRIGDAMSQLISIMVDNQKNPYSGKLGLNKHAAAIMANGIGLGIDVETIALLLNHPTIVDAYERGNNKIKPEDPSPMGILLKYYNSFKDATGKDAWKQKLFEEAQELEVTDDMLIEHQDTLFEMEKEVADLTNKDRERLTDTMLRQKLAVIKQMLALNNIKTHNSLLIGVSQLEKGKMRDVNAIKDSQDTLNELGMYLSKKDYLETENPFPYNFLQNLKDPNTTVGASIEVFEHLSENVLPLLVVTSTAPFQKLENLLKDGLSHKLSRDVKQVTHTKISRDILSYLTIKAYMHQLSRVPKQKKGNFASQTLKALDNSLIYDQMGDDSSVRINQVVAKLEKYLKENKITNHFVKDFIKNQKATAKQNKTGANIIGTRNFQRLTPPQISAIVTSFLELQIDPNTREAADHMLHYLMVTHGLQNRYGAFNQAIVPILLSSYLEDASKVKDLFGDFSNIKTQEQEDARFKNIFGMTFKELAKDLARWFESSPDTHLLTKITKTIKASELKNPDVQLDLPVKTVSWDKVANKRAVIQANPQTLYVIPGILEEDGNRIGPFGEIKDYPNVIIIPVKKTLKQNYDSQDYDAAFLAIGIKIQEIVEKSDNYDSIAFPNKGIGTDLDPFFQINRNKNDQTTKLLTDLNLKLLGLFGYKNAKKEMKPVEGSTTKITIGDDGIENIEKGKQTLIFKDDSKLKKDKTDIKKGKTKLVKFGKKYYEVKYLGSKTLEEAGGQQKVLEGLGVKRIPEVNKAYTNLFTDENHRMHMFEIVGESETGPKKEMKDTTATVVSEGRVTSPLAFRSIGEKDEENTIEISIYYGTGRRTKYIKGKKRKVSMDKYKKNKKIKENAKRLRAFGFKTKKIEDDLEVVLFPPVIRVYEKDKGYTYYRYVGGETPFGTTEITDDIYDVDGGQNALYGSTASYERFVPYGSKYQWKGGFIFNVNIVDGKVETQPTQNELQENVKKNQRRTSDGIVIPDISQYTEKNTAIGDTDVSNVNVDNDGADFLLNKETGETTRNNSKNVEEIKKGMIGVVTPREGGKKATADMFSKAENKDATIKKNQISDTTIDYKELEAWWYGAKKNDIIRVAQGMNMSGITLKDFKNEFEKVKEMVNLPNYKIKDFMERIKDCM